VTFSFADPAAGVCGLARLALAGDGTGSSLAVLFRGREMTASARGDVPADGADFSRLAVAGLATTVEEPLQRWTVASDDFELAFEAVGPPAALGADEPAALCGGMEGYEQLCRVSGTVRRDGEAIEVGCAGQRGHAWGTPDWDRIAATRTLSAWLDDGTGIALAAVRPAGAGDHEAEARWGALLAPAANLGVDDPRLSTTYDGAGFQRRVGLELWIGDEDAYPRRAIGETICGGSLDLGEQRLDVAFLRWRMDGRSGVGRYDLLRRA